MDNAKKTNEKELTLKLQSKQQWKNIGIAMTVLGILIGLGIESSNSDLGAMLLLIGLIGIPVWIVNARAANKLKRLNN